MSAEEDMRRRRELLANARRDRRAAARSSGEAATGAVTAAVIFEALATYKAECERGIVHTPEWDARMAGLQREFDAQVEAKLQEMRQPDGTILLPSWTPGAVFDAVRRIAEMRAEGEQR